MNWLNRYIPASILLLAVTAIDGKEIHFRSPQGEKLILNVDNSQSFNEVIEQVGFFFKDSKSVIISRAASDHVRDYSIPATKKQADDIIFVVTTMGFKGYKEIWNQESKLRATKNRLIDLHPFRFLEVIFTNEETKAGVANLKGKFIVGREFKNGLFPSLTEEAKKKNLKPEYIKDFAKIVGIDPKLISGAIQEGNWDKLLDLLIEHVPRSGNPHRYDM